VVQLFQSSKGGYREMRQNLLPIRRLDTAIKSTSLLNSIRFFSMSTRRLSDEDAKFDEQVKATEKWFSSPRFAETKRPYAAASVVEKRGTLPVIYPCDYQARKLWGLLGKYAAEKKPLLTMGAIDPVQMTQMAPHQEVLYVSGWACSSVLASGNSSLCSV
jgi:isocitrate lyase